MKYIICIGSNCNQTENINNVLNLLTQLFDIQSTEIIKTVPINTTKKWIYFNGLIQFSSDKDRNSIKAELKKIENEIRLPGSKEKGIIEIDLDIIMIDNEIVSRDYYNFEHIQKLMPLL